MDGEERESETSLGKEGRQGSPQMLGYASKRHYAGRNNTENSLGKNIRIERIKRPDERLLAPYESKKRARII